MGDQHLNLGIVTGQAVGPDGHGAAGAYVRLLSIRGDVSQMGFTGQGDGNLAEATADSSGRFRIAFGWAGADWAAGPMNISLELTAFTEKTGRKGRVEWSQVTAKGHATARGYMIKNTFGMVGLGLPQLQSATDLLSFSKDLIEAYRKVKSHPLFSVGMATPENWLLLAGTYLWMEP